jgi:aminopeptidase YwaD
MRRAIPALLALAFCVVQVAGSAAPRHARQGLLDAVSGARAYQHVLALARDIGPHAAGTPQDRASAEYIARQLAQDGDTVTWQAFSFPYFAAHAVALSVPALPSLALHPQALQYSASTPAAGITAPLVDLGLGRPEDVAGRRLTGRIALIERGGRSFRQKVDDAARAGALAAIIYNQTPGGFAGSLGPGVAIPAVSLPGADGRRLAALATRKDVLVRLTVQTVNEPRATWNLIGTKAGARDPHRVVVVGAHRDTVPGSPGANDNASGVAAALEVAQVLRGVPLADTVRFVLFGAEEEGLYGSAYYARHRGPDPIVGMIDLDMEGVGQHLELDTFRGPDTLARLAARLAARLGIPATIGHSGLSDHVSFERIGVPVVFLLRPDDPYYDTPMDTVDRVNPALLAASARLTLSIVLAVASR